MNVELNYRKGTCTVTREDGDPKLYGGSWGSGESQLLYWIKRTLNSCGHDLIKKRMWKDGHMVSDDQLYLRTRSPRSKSPHIMIRSGFFALRRRSHSGS